MTPANMTPELLDRYLAGEASATERETVEVWAGTDSARRDLVSALRRSSGVDTEAWLQRVKGTLAGIDGRHAIHERKLRRAKIGVLGAQPLPVGWRKKGLVGVRTPWYALAGVILTVMIVAFGKYAGSLGGSLPKGGAFSTYMTGNGERATIKLPDGNRVMLNVASRLEVPEDYLAGDHTLRLQGEALFDVVHHTRIPLSVVAGQTTAQVLGTSFVMRHYATDATTIVAVREGKVRVGSDVVTATHLIEVSKAGTPVFRAATPAQFSFATGILTLDGVTVPEAITQLDRWYDADIRLGDPTMASHGVIAGNFGVGSLSEVAEYLALILDARVVRDGRVLTVYPRR